MLPQGDKPSDAAILASLPGVGQSSFTSLLTEASGPLARRDYAALRTLKGVALVTKRSGKTCIVVMRQPAQARLCQAMFHWARIAVQHDPKSRVRYDALRARGHSYGRSLRGVADRLLGVACALLRRRAMFDPDHGMPALPKPNKHPLVRLSPTSVRSDRPSAERRAQALSRTPRSGAVRRRAASWTARARRYARRIGRRTPPQGMTRLLNRSPNA